MEVAAQCGVERGKPPRAPGDMGQTVSDEVVYQNGEGFIQRGNTTDNCGRERAMAFTLLKIAARDVPKHAIDVPAIEPDT